MLPNGWRTAAVEPIRLRAGHERKRVPARIPQLRRQLRCLLGRRGQRRYGVPVSPYRSSIRVGGIAPRFRTMSHS